MRADLLPDPTRTREAVRAALYGPRTTYGWGPRVVKDGLLTITYTTRMDGTMGEILGVTRRGV